MMSGLPTVPLPEETRKGRADELSARSRQGVGYRSTLNRGAMWVWRRFVVVLLALSSFDPAQDVVSAGIWGKSGSSQDQTPGSPRGMGLRIVSKWGGVAAGQPS